MRSISSVCGIGSPTFSYSSPLRRSAASTVMQGCDGGSTWRVIDGGIGAEATYAPADGLEEGGERRAGPARLQARARPGACPRGAARGPPGRPAARAADARAVLGSLGLDAPARAPPEPLDDPLPARAAPATAHPQAARALRARGVRR